MRLVPACYTSGRGASNVLGPGRCTITLKTNWNDLNLDCLFLFWRTSKLLTLLVPLSSKINAEVLPLHMYVH